MRVVKLSVLNYIISQYYNISYEKNDRDLPKIKHCCYFFLIKDDSKGNSIKKILNKVKGHMVNNVLPINCAALKINY